MYASDSPRLPRKRAFSEHYYGAEMSDADGGILGLKAMSRHSETNLLRINREKTFEGNLLDNTGNLLAKVVHALNNFNEEPVEQGGLNLFSDSEICLDESAWSVVTSATENNSEIEGPKMLRERAASEYGGGKFFNHINTQQNDSQDWTWAGNNPQIQELMKIRAKQKEREQNSLDNRTLNGVAIPIDEDKPLEDEGRRPSLLQKINKLFKRRSTVHQVNNVPWMVEPKPKMTSPTQPPRPLDRPFVAPTGLDKPSPLDNRKSFVAGNNANRIDRPQLLRRPSNYSILSSVSDSADQEVLENTTLADLIRAIEVVHMKEQGLDLLHESPLLRRGSIAQGNTNQSPLLRKAAMAFMSGPNQRPISKSQMASPSRLSPLPIFDSDDRSRRSSLNSNWERLRRNLTQQPFPTLFDNPGKAGTKPTEAPPIVKNKILEEKRSNFKRRYSAFPVAVSIGDSSGTKSSPLGKHLTKKRSDLERRFSVFPVASATNTTANPTALKLPSKSTLNERPPLNRRLSSFQSPPSTSTSPIPQPFLTKPLAERPGLNRRFSVFQLQQNSGLASKSVQVTPSSLRKSSLLPVSPLAVSPPISPLVGPVISPLAAIPAPNIPVRLKSKKSTEKMDTEQETRPRAGSRWRPLLRRIMADIKVEKRRPEKTEPKG